MRLCFDTETSGIPDFKALNLQETYKFFFGREFQGAHRAIADVIACREIYREIRAREKASTLEMEAA